MARPSNQDQRKEEILKAYEICVSLYGVEGATLKKVAEQAGLARPLLRHHVGNSEELLVMASDRFLARSNKSIEEFFEYLNEEQNTHSFLETLFFYENSENETTDILIAWAFMIASQKNHDLKKKMLIWHKSFRDRTISYLEKNYSNSNKNSIEIVADGIISLYYNCESSTPIFNENSLKENCFAAAQILLNTLEK